MIMRNEMVYTKKISSYKEIIDNKKAIHKFQIKFK